MLGIIVGVVSVITVVGVSQGIKQQINDQIGQLGKDVITVRPGYLSSQGNNGGLASGVKLLTGIDASSRGVLTEKDYQTIANTKGVRLAVPLSIISGQVTAGKKTLPSGTVLASSDALPSILHQNVEYGDFFDGGVNYEPNVAVIGQGVAQDLFGSKVPLGRSFNLLGQSFIVRGIFGQFDSAPLSLNANFNDSIFIPYSTAETLTHNNVSTFEVLARPDKQSETDLVASRIAANLKDNHNGQQHFTALTEHDSLNITNDILDSLTRLIVGVAAISLLVGGIGIMDVMLVSVTERMHEIGIRKAVGATNHQILMQFMIESSLLSLVGGFIGIIVSFLIELGLRTFTSLSPVISWPVVGLVVVVSLLVGVVFGTAPAIKAARKRPIDALRNE